MYTPSLRLNQLREEFQMAKKTFFSFHYKPDNWRASTVRSIGALDGNKPVSDNDWETITKGGDPGIERWIATQMSGRACAVVLIGSATAGRKWIKYEIKKAWDDRLGVVGIYVHNLLDATKKQSTKGSNPFDGLTVEADKKKLSALVKAYDPPYTTSTNVYGHIAENIASWVDDAIAVRQKY